MKDALKFSGLAVILVGTLGTKACTEDYFFADKTTPGTVTTVSSTTTTDPNLDTTTTTSTTLKPSGVTTTTRTTTTTTTTLPGTSPARGFLRALGSLDNPTDAESGKDSAVGGSSGVKASGAPARNWLGNLYGGEEIAGQAVDSDNDGYSDQLERDFNTNSGDAASFPAVVVTHLQDRLTGLDDEGDGLVNDDEVRLHLNPKVADTDGDGVLDGLEVLAGSEPKDARSVPLSDFDGDGLTDKYEIEKGYDFQSSDSDSDGVSDTIEILLGMNLLSNDSDHDGVLDAKEIELGSDPTVPESRE